MSESKADAKTTECPSCLSGRMEEGTTTLTFPESHVANGMIVVVTGVPAEICDVCGEAIVDSETVERVNELVKDARYLWNRFPDRLYVEGVTVGGEPGTEGGVVRIDYDTTKLTAGRAAVRGEG